MKRSSAIFFVSVIEVSSMLQHNGHIVNIVCLLTRPQQWCVVIIVYHVHGNTFSNQKLNQTFVRQLSSIIKHTSTIFFVIFIDVSSMLHQTITLSTFLPLDSPSTAVFCCHYPSRSLKYLFPSKTQSRFCRKA